MVVCADVVGRKLHWTRSGEEFLLRDGDELLCTMGIRPLQVDCDSEGCSLVIRRKGLLRPRLEISDCERPVASIGNLDDFEPQLMFEDGAAFTLRYLNEARTALASFDADGNNVMELTDVSTWSEPRTELVVNRWVQDLQAMALMTVGHYLMMQKRDVLL